MAWLVPYVINGAAHSAALFRRQAQRPATDQVGVSRPGDLKVTQLPAAATGFRIAQGGLSLPSRFPGRGRESYGVENGDAVIDVTDVPGTGSSARRDAIVVELLDPNYLPITHEDAALTNYMTVHVVQEVAAGAKTIDNIPSFNNRTAYVLAFINWPASTTSITNAMIQDARVLASPEYMPFKISYALSGAEVDAVTSTSAYPAGGQTWPIQAEVAAQLLVDIPDWATHVMTEVTLYGVHFPGGEASGAVWLRIGANTGLYISGQDTRWDSDGVANSQRNVVGVADTLALPEAMRGTTQQFRPRALRFTGTNATTARLDRVSSVVIDGMFIQRAI